VTFTPDTFANFVAQASPVHARVTPSHTGSRTDFDILVVGTGIGGGVLADELADRFGTDRRILVLEAGSNLYPTHVYNCSRLSNGAVAGRFGCSSFWQAGDPGSQNYIHERPQMNLGGRSVFWSGLIPTVQDWELSFFPERVRKALVEGGLLEEAGRRMNQSVSLGDTARGIVDRLAGSDLGDDFVIQETPRALHQPYLRPDGSPAGEFFVESTGVFNTAELLINQLGLSSGQNSGGDGPGLRMLLHHYVEDLRRLPDGRLELVARNTLTGAAAFFQSRTVVLACGSIESPKLLARSTLGRGLRPEVAGLVGRGLTDHPTTVDVRTIATHIGDLAIPKNATAKIVLYSKGRPGDGDAIRYPFNVEMNVNHEYWHLRENDPSQPETPIGTGAESIIDIKFSFGNCLDPANEIRPAPPFGYVPEIVFRNQNWTDHLVGSRFPALAGWNKTDRQVFDILNDVAGRVLSKFRRGNTACRPDRKYGEDNRGFGLGTVHHAAGSLRMPAKPSHDGGFDAASVVDEDLMVVGEDNLYVCDMSVMPLSTAANPVRTLAALALRLSRHID
jgi:hypothetical protein